MQNTKQSSPEQGTHNHQLMQFSCPEDPQNCLFDQQQNKTYYGRYIILLKDKFGRPTLLLGPHWFIFVISLLASLALLAWQFIVIMDKTSKIWLFILTIFAIIYAYSYIRIGLSNPGFAPPSYNLTQQQKKMPQYCSICQTLRSRKIHHCYDCNVCIEGYDHHCPWIGKCVGSGNIYSFYFFVCMAFTTMMVCFACGISAAPSLHKKQGNSSEPIIQG